MAPDEDLADGPATFCPPMPRGGSPSEERSGGLAFLLDGHRFVGIVVGS